jgi:hypothetical protein
MCPIARRLFPLLSLAGLLVTAAPAHASLDFYEPFKYNFTGPQQAITNLPAFAGSNYWFTSGFGALGNLTNITLSSPGLLTAGGNSAALGIPINGGGIRRFLIDPTTTKSNFYTSGDVYFSLLVNVLDRGALRTGSASDTYKSANGSTLWALGCNPGVTTGSNANAYICLAAQQQTDTNTYKLGVSKNSGVGVLGTTVFSNETVFVVGKYSFVSGGNDTVSMWINPSATTFGASEPPVDVTTGSAQVNAPNVIGMNCMNFRCTTSGANQANPNMTAFSEIRIGTTWADVTPAGTVTAPQPKLSITSTDPTHVTVTWGTTDNYAIQSAAQLLSVGTVWSPTGPTNVSGTNYSFTDTVSGAMFYRLIKQ